MKILFVGDAYCVHTARWIAQLEGTGWEIHLFDPLNRLIHDSLRGVHLHTGWKKASVPPDMSVSYRWPFLRGRHFVERNLSWLWRWILPDAERRLADLIGRLAPDCLHSLGLQHQSTALLAARRLLGGQLPAPWIYSCRGSDIYFFRHEARHQEDIQGVLAACDFYICNCGRDLRLAKDHGFRGEFLGYFQGGGGFPIAEMRELADPGLPAERRVITVKGLETQFGRGLRTLDALRLCAPKLRGYEIVVYQAHPSVEAAAGRFAEETGLSVVVVPRTSPANIWRQFGRSRVSIGISKSDGVPNAMLESMIQGAFPIQTDPGGASSEWIEDGLHGLLVPHDDMEAIAEAVTRALGDDDLVNRAAELNLEKLEARADTEVVRNRAIDAYRRVVERSPAAKKLVDQPSP